MGLSDVLFDAISQIIIDGEKYCDTREELIETLVPLLTPIFKEANMRLYIKRDRGIVSERSEGDWATLLREFIEYELDEY